MNRKKCMDGWMIKEEKMDGWIDRKWMVGWTGKKRIYTIDGCLD